MTKDEALKLAMDWYGSGNQDPDEFEKLILSIVAQPEQKPVAWGVFDGPNLHDMFFTQSEAQDMVRLKGDGSTVAPLYTAPPQRIWVGLTDDEMTEIVTDIDVDWGDLLWKVVCLTKIIEAQLEERNNG